MYIVMNMNMHNIMYSEFVHVHILWIEQIIHVHIHVHLHNMYAYIMYMYMYMYSVIHVCVCMYTHVYNSGVPTVYR